MDSKSMAKKIQQKKSNKKRTKKIKKQTKQEVRALSLTLTPAPIKEKQLLFILQRTPKQHIYTRKGKAGMFFEYVTGVYVKKALNHIFGWMWDFEIKDKGREGDLAWVQGRLTIKNKSGKPMIIKEQFGRADIKFKKDMPHKPENMLDYGNDLKAAATDALKKCASELGIASDVYGKQEFQEIQKEDKGFTPPKIEVVESKVEPIVEPVETGKKVDELKKMLKGSSDEEKAADLKARTSIKLTNGFNITEKHASVLIAQVLNSETK